MDVAKGLKLSDELRIQGFGFEQLAKCQHQSRGSRILYGIEPTIDYQAERDGSLRSAGVRGTVVGIGLELSVVLPTFNERANIAPLIEAVEVALAEVSHEILVMDDRSPDGTAEAARLAARTRPQVRVVERQPPPGLTRSLLDGVRLARARYVVWLDCDFSHPPELLPRLLEPLRKQEAEVTCASRYVPGGSDDRESRAARWASLAINRLARWLLGEGVRDYTTGYVMASRQLVLDLGLRGEYGEYCIDFLARAERGGHRVREIPYANVPRAAGTSKTATTPLGFLRRGWRYLLTILRLWWTRPASAAGGQPA